MLVGEDVFPQALPEGATDVPLQWEGPGIGTTLLQGRAVKAEVCVTTLVQGRSVEVEKCNLRARLGDGPCVPAVEVLPTLYILFLMPVPDHQMLNWLRA